MLRRAERCPALPNPELADAAWILERLPCSTTLIRQPGAVRLCATIRQQPWSRAALTYARYFIVDDQHHIARERLHTAGRLRAYDEYQPNMPSPLRGRDLATLGLCLPHLSPCSRLIIRGHLGRISTKTKPCPRHPCVAGL